MHEGGGPIRPMQGVTHLRFGVPNGPPSQVDVVDQPGGSGGSIGPNPSGPWKVPQVGENGDLLEGIVAAVALLVMMAIDMTLWLAIPLAVMTYLGVALLRPPRQQQDETVDEPGPGPLADEPPADVVMPEELLDTAARANADKVAARFGLTRREREILPLLAQRLTDREIADRLCISHRTAMNHVASILAKLGLASRRDVAAFAAQHGLLPPSLPPTNGK